jgi:hypothetical protein
MTLSFVEARFASDGLVTLEFDLDVELGHSLIGITLDLVEEDNWRLHPDFPGGSSFELSPRHPSVHGLNCANWRSIQPLGCERDRPTASCGHKRPAPYRKPGHRPRDAVIFRVGCRRRGSSSATISSRHCAAITLIRDLRWHQPWVVAEMAKAAGGERSGRNDSTGCTNPYHASDPTGFVAALDAYRHHDESFELVWFGHNKGGDHLDNLWYATGRWMIERTFWSLAPRSSVTSTTRSPASMRHTT